MTERINKTDNIIDKVISMIQNGISESRVKHELYNILDNHYPDMNMDDFKREILLKERKVVDLYNVFHSEKYSWMYENLVILENFVEDVENDYIVD